MVNTPGENRWWVRVGDVVLPAPVAGHPALELPNTWAGWTSPGGRDYLTSGRDLAVLAADRDLVSWTAETDDTHLPEARELRAAVYRLLAAHGTDVDLALVSRLAAEARTHQRLVRADDGGTRWRLERSAGARAPVLAAAAAATDLLVHGDPARVHVCPGVGCGWLFLDTSGRRRWCSMTVCGNRAKQAAHAARTGSGGLSEPGRPAGPGG